MKSAFHKLPTLAELISARLLYSDWFKLTAINVCIRIFDNDYYDASAANDDDIWIALITNTVTRY